MKVKRILHGVLLVLGLSVIGLLFSYLMWLITDEEFRDMLKQGWPFTSGMILLDYAACCLLTTLITLYYWRSREKAERERDKFRLQALENQLSPHFVFNNFSILADLIEVDPKRASAYLMNLSKVYRYTLQHLDHSTVSLQEELEFLQRYLALLQQRFGDGIVVEIRPDVTQRQGALPPAALQMLIENAIKHNEHTTARPLHIFVTSDEGHISVSNRKQPITTAESTLVGQHNIAERYRLLTDQKVIISDTTDEYCVTIPLIN
ncbi:Histidine kinase [Xylanibacter ruminicola]|uniref:Histidine kinase n=1 Tax=Xylanibacter ruminicola TaxID=839 RepID=A0A1H4DMF6_XYLRU|nr:sensor histidine kinase [Xylanibacter ruminicola]SEA73620.1 Histidine kinase [Xylanibacter ruminicola]